MSERITVPRAEIADLVGLPHDCTDEQLNTAVEATLARHRAAERVAAAEAAAVAEDKKLVAAAIGDGRIPVERREFWINACARDRVGNRAMLASLAPVLVRPNRPLASDEVEAIHSAVLRRMGLSDAPRSVAAAAPAPAGPQLVKYDDLGLPIAQLPEPVRISRGKPREQWTRDEQYAEFAHTLGGRFAAASPRPPVGDSYYVASGNDVTLPSESATGEVTWQLNPHYQPRGD